MTPTTPAETVVLQVQTRTDDSAPLLRRRGIVPLELYGRGQTNRHLMADRQTVTNLLRRHGTATLIDVTDEQNQVVKTLARAPQYHPVTHNLLHLDLYQVDLKAKITAAVPLIFTGRAPVVEDLGGTLIETKTEVEVECLPQDLPHEIEVNITGLTSFDDVRRISDLSVPPKVTILDEPDEVICSVAEPRSEEELAALDEKVEEDVEGVEVETKGKEEEGAETEGTETAAEPPATPPANAQAS